ncbi:hypothetical protein Acor_42540 [Acrocarpospora corrugata]|uniref:Uncharacterized protein n=1 Tax=Acrocarpospora corrugata TaxID=35763 RepID=A0A5M3W1L5_9ACTN|nr:hypothetical protein Acor_42540 [Acrocarpospora corrugata]
MQGSTPDTQLIFNPSATGSVPVHGILRGLSVFPTATAIEGPGFGTPELAGTLTGSSGLAGTPVVTEFPSPHATAAASRSAISQIRLMSL